MWTLRVLPRRLVDLCEKRTTARKSKTLRGGGIRFSDDNRKVHHCHGVSSFAEHTVVSEEVAIKITDELPLGQAALLGCGVVTGVNAVTNTTDIETGSSVVVFGASGVGINSVQAVAFREVTELVVVDPIE